MTTVVTRGAASAQALGYASSSAAVNYIEDVFSTYLYTGAGGNPGPVINNGINLSGKGGLVWIKSRSNGAYGHVLHDTVRGLVNRLSSNNSNAQSAEAGDLSAFNSTGFTVGYGAITNDPSETYASWTFREQPKFFDIVTYTGDGVAGRSIAHNLGSTPGCIIVKCTSLGATDWQVYHVGLGAMPTRIVLNSTNAADSSDHFYATPTSSVFYVNNYQSVNQNAATYVAYLFAHNAGGFGLTGTDNVISCGSYTGNGTSENNVTLGYEPQWVLIKDTTTAYKWLLMDNMRGFQMGTSSAVLSPNSSDAETANGTIQPSATGFTLTGGGGFLNGSGDNYIYIAIRRGPMKVPTSGTSVFSPQTYTANSTTGVKVNCGFPVDTVISNDRTGTTSHWTGDRLRGGPLFVQTSTASAELNGGAYRFYYDYSDGFLNNFNDGSNVSYLFRRAPGFFDEVCYTGTGSATTVTHNLGVAPEFIQVKCRSNANGWMGYSAPTGNTKYISFADVDSAQVSSTAWNNTSPTSSVFTVGTDNSVNGSARTYVAYLFATVAGVSKVGSYTGNGTTQTIDCGFGAGGVRFVLIKRTDSTGNWYVYDTARGMSALTDPYLLLDNTAAEVATLGSVTTVSTGFALNSAILAAINVNAGTYIFLAIA